MREGVKRNIKIDFIRGFAIFLVVWGHSIQFLNNNEFDFFKNPIFIFIYSFHMPLFMFISGYLFSYSINKRNFKELIIYRLKRLVVPILAWGILISLISISLNFILRNNINIMKEFFTDIKALPYQLWFLWGLFYCSIITIIGQKYFKNSIIFYILIGVLMIFVPDYINSHLYKFVYPYFILGYFINDFKEIIYRYKKIITKISFIIFPVMLLLWKKQYYIYISHISILKENPIIQLENIVFRWIIGGIGIIFIISIINYYFKYINSEKINKIVCNLGVYSLGIYIISGYIFQVLEKFHIPVNNMFIYNTIFTTVISAIIIKICIIISKKIQLNVYLNRFLLGGK